MRISDEQLAGYIDACETVDTTNNLPYRIAKDLLDARRVIAQQGEVIRQKDEALNFYADPKNLNGYATGDMNWGSDRFGTFYVRAGISNKAKEALSLTPDTVKDSQGRAGV
jgi:hypothetical protein